MPDPIKYTPEDLVDHHGVSAVIKNPDGEVLMQEHVKYGFWTIPVGKAIHGQEIVDGLKQEVLEETGLTVEECKEIGSKTCEYVRAGRNVKVFTHLFEITKYSGTLENREPHKHRQQKFLSLSEIMKLSYLSDTTLMYLKTLGLTRENRS
jgi:8-oxo-dGTP diphosphatase